MVVHRLRALVALALIAALLIAHLNWPMEGAIPAGILIGFAFGAAGAAVTAFIRSWQDFDLVQLAALPMFLFSGTFFPITVYPEPLRLVIEWTPLYHGVNLIRGLTTGADEYVGKPYDASLDSVVHAQFSAAYSFARALGEGRVGPKSYERPAITEATVVKLAQRIRAGADIARGAEQVLADLAPDRDPRCPRQVVEPLVEHPDDALDAPAVKPGHRVGHVTLLALVRSGWGD